MESAAISKAGRNAIVTSMVVCCGFVACWSTGQITHLLRYIGYEIDFNTWFYHFTSYCVNSSASTVSNLCRHRLFVIQERSSNLDQQQPYSTIGDYSTVSSRSIYDFPLLYCRVFMIYPPVVFSLPLHHYVITVHTAK